MNIIPLHKIFSWRRKASCTATLGKKMPERVIQIKKLACLQLNDTPNPVLTKAFKLT